MPGLTTRLKLPWAKLEEGADIEAAVKPLAEKLDPTDQTQPFVSMIQVGTGTPPATVPPAGAMYMRTVIGATPRIYISDGTAWQALGTQGGSAPIGAMMAWSSSTAPTDPEQPTVTWRYCNGAPLLIADYPDYAAIVGNKWGGDATNVNVPDLRGRTLIGADNGAGRTSAPNNVIGKATGTEKHPLGYNEVGVPPHGHGVSDPGHSHLTQLTNGFNAASGEIHAASAQGVLVAYFETTDNKGTGVTVNGHTGTVPQPHNNMQPSAVIDWYIRIK